MKTAKFTQNRFTFFKNTACITACIVCYTGAAHAGDGAEPPAPGKSADLVLTLPNQWQPAETSPLSGTPKSARENDDASGAPAGPSQSKPPVNLGCEVAVGENLSLTSSLMNRVEGNCKLNYHY